MQGVSLALGKPPSRSCYLLCQLSMERLGRPPVQPHTRTLSHTLTLLLPPSLPPPSAPHRFSRLSGTPNNSSNKIQEYLGKTSHNRQNGRPGTVPLPLQIYISPPHSGPVRRFLSSNPRPVPGPSSPLPPLLRGPMGRPAAEGEGTS